MEFRLLGSVEMWQAGRLVATGAPRQRTVLAALLVDAGRVVSPDVLIDRVWGEMPPNDARPTLNAYLSRIRGVLGDGRLIHRAGGYVLTVEPDRVDVLRLRRLVSEAGDPACGDDRRVALLREAVELWRGEPLAGLSGAWVDRTRRAWGQQRLDLLVAWAHAEVRAANPTAVIGPLMELADEHPLAESVAAVLMQALAGAGRTADALELYATMRRRLADEIGTDPGAELQAVHRRLLQGQPSASARPPLDQVAHERTVPRQLPGAVPDFVGRAGEMSVLSGLLARSGSSAGTVTVAAIAGMAGVGKTALAVHWAHRVAHQFPDGQLYINLRGFAPGTGVDPAEAVRAFLHALGVAPQRIPSGLDAQTAMYRSLLADRRMLVLLDNARDTAQVRPLLPGNAECLVLVTSRNLLTSLIAEGARPVGLDLLSIEDAWHFFADRIGAARLATDPGAAWAIIDRCGRLPLALSIVAARAAGSPRLPLASIAGELTDGEGWLDVLAGDEPHSDVRAAFSWSYRALPPASARLFRLLGLHFEAEIVAPAAASLAGVPEALVRPQLAELCRANLIVEQAADRYTLHDLLRAYAADLGRATDSQEVRDAATDRLLGHYLHSAYAAALNLFQQRDPITLGPPEPGVVAESTGDHEATLAWFTDRYPTLVAAVHHALATGRYDHAWQLAWSLTDFLHQNGRWHDWASAARAAAAAADQLADPALQSRAHRNLANAYALLGHLDDARAQLRLALELSTSVDDLASQANTHRTLAHLWSREGRYAEALDHGRQALALFTSADHRNGQARALNAIGWYHAQSGEYEQALDHCRQALALLTELGDGNGQAATWDSLGYAHLQLQQYAEAFGCYERCAALCRELSDRYGEAVAHTHLGDAHWAAGDAKAAEAAWRHAVTIFDDLRHPEAEQVRAKLNDLARR